MRARSAVLGIAFTAFAGACTRPLAPPPPPAPVVYDPPIPPPPPPPPPPPADSISHPETRPPAPSGGSPHPQPRPGDPVPVAHHHRANGERASRSPASDGPPTIADAERKLAPAALTLDLSDTLRAKHSSDIRISISRDSLAALAAGTDRIVNGPDGPHRQVTRQTRIGDEATICVRADTNNFQISGGDSRSPAGDGMCSLRAVSQLGLPSPWVFHVLPRDTGSKDLEVEVRAAFNDQPSPIVVYDSVYHLRVYVGEFPDLAARIIAFLEKWKAVLLAVSAILAAVAGILSNWRKIFGAPNPETAPPDAAPPSP